MNTLSFVSLFSGGGLGDIGFRQAGLRPILLNEIDEKRAELCQLNFPESEIIADDICSASSLIVDRVRSKIPDGDLFLLTATPPCQGMSKNGIGSILKAMRDGKRPSIDNRNALFLPALDIVEQLRPRFVFFENVDRIFNTYFTDQPTMQPVKMVDYIEDRFSRLGYFGAISLVDFADYGLPQHRSRAVGVFARSDLGVSASVEDLLPTATHGPRSSDGLPWVTLRDSVYSLPVLDSKNRMLSESRVHHLHKVPVSRPELYRWIKHTKPAHTAFENDECISCKHLNQRQDILCRACGEILAKPNVRERNEPRLIRGFVSAYKRMPWDEPSPTITTRSAYACSDHNLHPDQNRVLSLLEVCLLQGLDPADYKWGPVLKRPVKAKSDTLSYAPDTLLRDILGEPVSPLLTKQIAKHLFALTSGERLMPRPRKGQQCKLVFA